MKRVVLLFLLQAVVFIIAGCMNNSNELDRYGSQAEPYEQNVEACSLWQDLIAANYDGQWGYIDAQGEWAIDPQFDDARDFTVNALAAVRVGDYWGFINEQGNWAIDPQFEETQVVFAR
jgi:hypothetical protein